MKTQKIYISGIVQGVGFRPFVYNLAQKFCLKGFVKNINSNVVILIQSKDEKKLHNFMTILRANPPQNAVISRITICSIKNSEKFSDFCILKSEKSSDWAKYSAIPRDLALCKVCEKELKNSRNRRFGYAFINCINCGPRFSIIKNLPYDRERTAMSDFKMCPFCECEYKDITNRRFHAQPNSCVDCGITMQIYDNGGNVIDLKLDANQNAIFAFVREKIKSGNIICFKGIGGFNLICAVEKNVIATLRVRKSRPRKPFAIMFGDIKTAKKYFHISKYEESALLSPSAPIVLLTHPKVKLPQNLSYNLNTYGVIIAYSALHKLLFQHYAKPLIFTSANLSGESIIADKATAEAKLRHIYDYLLDYNRVIVNPIDDSLKRILFNGKAIILRAGRGDYPLLKHTKLKSNEVILALGAHQKSQIAIFFSGYILISRYIGDLDNISVIESYMREIEFLLNLYNLTPSVILCDCHKSYESSKIAFALVQKFGAKLGRIYHHRAHFYSCLLDNNLTHKDENILGVVFDGTGYGENGTIWGGEFFLLNKFADYSMTDCLDYHKSIEKSSNSTALRHIAHFSNFALLGGESAIKDIRKIALGVLFSVYGEAIPLASKFPNVTLFYQMQQNNINSPKTSSVGRIFDFVAFMCGLESQSFEGESGGYIESLYSHDIGEYYDFEIINGKICIEKIVCGIIGDYIAQNPCDLGDLQDLHTSHDFRNIIATKFINTLAQIILQITLDLHAHTPNLKVIFSGGVFANKILCDKISALLHKIPHFFHREIPTNDGGIAVGQIVAFLRGDFSLEI